MASLGLRPTHRAWSWVQVLLGYAALASLLTWPLALHLNEWTLAWPNPDSMDTSQLRRVVAMGLDHNGWSSEMFPPTGYPAADLMPNRLDHLLAVPSVRGLPWPLADNLWWLAILALNGIAGHMAGWALGGSHRHGVLCGVAVACAEPVLREANLGHAPQTMVFSGVGVVAFMAMALSKHGSWRHGVGLGLSMAFAGLTYWYFGLFFAMLCIPIVAAAALRQTDRPRLRWVGLGALICLIIVAFPLASAVSGWEQLAMTSREMLPGVDQPNLQVLPQSERFLFSQSNDVTWPFRSVPPARSNRVHWLLLGAAIWGSAVQSPHRWRWWLAACLGGVMVMGPFLAFGGDPVLLGDRPIALPWYGLAKLSPLLERLHWPQRWGIVVPLALLPRAARCPRPLFFAGLLVVETVVFSVHAPLGYTPTTQFDGWRTLSTLPDTRSVLVFPLERSREHMAPLAYAYRAAEQPLVAQTFLPAGAASPDAWWETLEEWGAAGPPTTPIAIDALRAAGVGAVVLDTTPGGGLHPRDYDRSEAALARRLGPDVAPAVDYGSVRVWWLTPPDPVPAGLENPQAWQHEQFQVLAEFDAIQQQSPVAGMQWNLPRAYKQRRPSR